MIRRPPRSTLDRSSAASDVYKRQAVQDALHAHVLLRRDVDYVVNDDAVLSVDEIKGRIVSDRRWPAGLQTALELSLIHI